MDGKSHYAVYLMKEGSKTWKLLLLKLSGQNMFFLLGTTLTPLIPDLVNLCSEFF